MAFFKFTFTETLTYPAYSITANPGKVFDFGSSSPPADGYWVSDPGPATAVPDNPSIVFPPGQPITYAGPTAQPWTAVRFYPAGSVVLHPSGQRTIVRTAAGTSRSSYDATEAALWADSAATYQQRSRLPTSAGSPFADAARLHATYSLYVVGVDTVAGHAFAQDTTNGNFKRTDNYDFNTSAFNINLPAGIAYNNVGKIVRYAGNIYLSGYSTVSTTVEVWQAAPVTGATAYVWTKVLTSVAGTTAKSGNLTATSTCLLATEYGDPVGGPNIYRSTDGTTWTTVFTSGTSRHMHYIAEDPNNLGTIYATGGDGQGTSLLRSTNSGVTWTVQNTNSVNQGVQISFDADWMYVACDSQQGTFLVYDRATLTPTVGTPNWHANLAVPGGAAADLYYRNAYWGAVDPATGVYYCVSNDTSVAGNVQGLFYCPRVGQPVQVLYKGAAGINLNGEILFANGYLWSGGWKRPLLAAPVN